MKFKHEPDYAKIREQKYKESEGDLLAAIVETIEANQGVLMIPDSMLNMLAIRADIKEKVKKPKKVK